MAVNTNLGRQWEDAWAPNNDPQWATSSTAPKPKRQSRRALMRDEGFLAKHVQATQCENEAAGYKTEETSFFKEHTPVRIGDHEADWKRYSQSQQ